MVKVSSASGEFSLLMLDISGGGCQLILDSLNMRMLEDGSAELHFDELAPLPLISRWRLGPKVGASFRIGPATKTALANYLAQKYQDQGAD